MAKGEKTKRRKDEKTKRRKDEKTGERNVETVKRHKVGKEYKERNEAQRQI
jgi:hypothetical protein